MDTTVPVDVLVELGVIRRRAPIEERIRAAREHKLIWVIKSGRIEVKVEKVRSDGGD